MQDKEDNSPIALWLRQRRSLLAGSKCCGNSPYNPKPFSRSGTKSSLEKLKRLLNPQEISEIRRLRRLEEKVAPLSLFSNEIAQMRLQLEKQKSRRRVKTKVAGNNTKSQKLRGKAA